MSRRAPPGPRLATGRIRVDAARAIAKLRDYQLVDRNSWVLEAIRAAICSGARRVSLAGDANDVWLAWDGEPWPAAVLPTLFDELVSPEPARASQHLRLLAAAINTALGLDPAHVDVIAISGDRAACARYTPDTLEPADIDGEPTLRDLDVIEIARPDHEHAPATGMLVHLRRPAGWGTLVNLVRGEPPELAIARAACADATITIAIAGVEHQRDRHARDVLRHPLGDGLDGFVALVDPYAGSPAQAIGATVEAAEHGVVLARFGLLRVFDHEIVGTANPAPVRVFVDGPRMPTNASRSEVRRDAHPIAAAEARARAIMPAFVAAIAARFADTELPEAERERLRRAILALLVAYRPNADWREPGDPHADLRPLAELPLLADAVGQLRPTTHAWRRGIAHTGSVPLPLELAPWVHDILWLSPTDAAARVAGYLSTDATASKRLLKAARRAQRAMTRFRRHATRSRTVKARGSVRARIALDVVAVAAGERLEGELCLLGRGEGGEIVLLHDDRELEILRLPSVVPYQAVVSSGALRPTADYRAAVRDDRFARVVHEVRLAVLDTAVKFALVRAGAAWPAGVSGERDVDPDAEAELLRSVIALAHELAYPLTARSPLATAPIWPDIEGRQWSLAELLARAGPIGVTARGVTGRSPGRPVLALDVRDRATITALLDKTCAVVSYEAATLADVDRARDLARNLVGAAGVALAIREPGRAIAIAPGESEVRLYHRGVRLETRPYPAVLLRCTIAADADCLVPRHYEGHGWAGIQDYGKLELDPPGWERALVRAIAEAIAGAPVPDLLRSFVGLQDWDPGGRALLRALAAPAVVDVDELLGAATVAKLRRVPFVTVLGELAARSIDDVVGALPAGPLPVVPPMTLPVPGSTWRAIVAEPPVSIAIGRLAKRAIVDGRDALERLRKQSVRAAHLARHRSQPVLELELPGDSVPLESSIGSGLVGVGDDALDLRIRVEGRRFAQRSLTSDLPLAAVVEVGLSHVDESFTDLSEHALSRLVVDIRAAAVPLLLAALGRDPRSIVDDARVRRLLARLVAKTALPNDVRVKLAGAEVFPTIQGGRVAIDTRGPTRITAWTGDWLPPADGEPPHSLDRPILAVSPGSELYGIVKALSRRVWEVDEEVERLQTARRVAHGLIPRPTIVGADPVVTRRLEQLGDRGRGIGELALVDDRQSLVIPFHAGRRGSAIAIDVLPPVRLAIEAPDVVESGIRTDAVARWAWVQAAATQLVRELASDPAAAVPSWARRRIRHAVLAGRFDGSVAWALPILETTADEWLPWQALEAQRARFHKVWYASAECHLVPLDAERRAFRLQSHEVALAQGKHGFVDGNEELRLDAIARDNQQRPRVEAPTLSPDDVARGLGKPVELVATAPGHRRGYVLPLAPSARNRRALRAITDGFPFDARADPCPWPTLAVVADPALAPDRTWSRPCDDAALTALREAAIAVSNRALRALGPAPAGAIAEYFIEPLATDDRMQRVGRVWLHGPPDAPAGVQVTWTDAEETHVGAQLPLGGWLAVAGPVSSFGPFQLDARVLTEAYRALVGQAVARCTGPAPDENALAHVALALVRTWLHPTSAPSVTFRSVSPQPCGAATLVELVTGDRPVLVVAAPTDGVRALIDDGSIVSRVLLAEVGANAKRYRPEPPARARPPSAPVQTVVAPAPPHPLQGLADAVWARMSRVGVTAHHPVSVAVAPGVRTPIVRHREGAALLAGDSDRLRAIEAARIAGTAWADVALDALAAHVVTVLNAGLSSITDGAEADAIARLLGEG